MSEEFQLPIDAGEAVLHALIRESDKDYRANAIDHLVSCQLRDFIQCPFLYYKKKQKQTKGQCGHTCFIDRAAHTLVLDGLDCFEQAFAIGGPFNMLTGKPYESNDKAFIDWCRKQGKLCITRKQAKMVEQIDTGVKMNPVAVELLTCGRAGGVARAEYCGMLCQACIDWFHPRHGIVEFKTCDDLDGFEAESRSCHYVRQMAFDMAVLAQMVNIYVPVHFVVAEKKEPFRCGVWLIHPYELDEARRDNERAMERLRSCIECDLWPTGYETKRVWIGEPRNR